jgi:L-aspartate oxidase
MQRKESRGLHYTLDYPETDENQAEDTVLTPNQPTHFIQEKSVVIEAVK